MSLEENREAVRREVAFWNGHDPEALGEAYAESYAGHDPAGFHAGDFEQLKGAAAAVFAAYPDLALTADNVIVEGDMAVKQWTVHATHKGELMGVAPTGKKIVVTGTNIFRVANGKIVECWAQMDALGMWQQLGVIPPLG
jgi:predicted ester cyclase